MNPMNRKQGGFILIFTLLMLLGISTLAIGMVYNAHHGQVAAQNYKNSTRAFYASDGMRTLLAQEVMDGNSKRYLDSSMSGEVEGGIWNGAGTSMASLKAAISGRAPNEKVTSPYLGSNWKYRSNYGVRWRGYVIPPATGSYTFFVRADDQGELRLSSDEQPANLAPDPIAKVASFAFAWPVQGSGISKPVTLKMGKRYYFEFLHAQGYGPGFGQIGWNGPNYLSERPIPGKRLALVGSRREHWDTAGVGKAKVKYALDEAGPLVFTVSTEAITGGKGDTTYRSPLNQTLSMRGDNPAPPDSLWHRVIFYDFHSNGSNPDFERGAEFDNGVPTPGMVRRKGLRYTTENAAYFGLDSVGKPRRGFTPRYNCGVERWFIGWTPGWFGTYNYAGGGSDCSVTNPGHDRAFANVVLKDSLLFLRRADLGSTVYQFKRFEALHAPAFLPLDGRGFGSEGLTDPSGKPRNYSFCMELHSKFEHTSGLIFEFNGDDDVWLFINDSLVMDLGFVHPSAFATVSLDDLPLTFGETYPLDFFYCERKAMGSSIDVISNLPAMLKAARPVSSWKRDYGDTE